MLIAALIMFSTVLPVTLRADRQRAALNAITTPIRLLKSARPAVSVLADPHVVGPRLSPPLTTPIGSVLITLRQNGFEPSEITRPAGRVFLVVQNRSGFQNVQLRLDPSEGSRLYDVAVPRSQLDWVQVVDFQPGGYTLTDAYHPDWLCKIDVTN